MVAGKEASISGALLFFSNSINWLSKYYLNDKDELFVGGLTPPLLLPPYLCLSLGDLTLFGSPFSFVIRNTS